MSDVLNTIGLILGMIGVGIIFKYGPLQPAFAKGVSLGLEDNTPIDPSGKTVAEYNTEIGVKRRLYSIKSRIGLRFIFVGFGFQLWATWAR